MSAISSCISGEFNGTEDEVVYKLDNGQIWQQIGYRYRYRYMYRPRVTITHEAGGYVMHVNGFSEGIRVRRIA